ncbi:anti-sigma factor [Paenibacillus lautus]|uniref:anti-sigma factor n=1 Tax=Paenibacillus lautus TaxID=1401 RepID=UPI000FDBE1DA|nr:anti-sigma factor [Paenibacillus lautus]
MSEEFKQRLKDYADGKLSDEEKIEIEREMEKLEEYQAYVNEMMDNEGSSDASPPHAADDQAGLSPKKEKRIVRRGKWKARISNTLTVISAFLAITVISSIITALFYGVGDPSRNDKYRDAIASAISISHPNIEVPLNSQGKIFFMQEVYGDIDKKVGKERVTVGEYTVNFLFGLPSVDVDWNSRSSSPSSVFYRPDSPSEASSVDKEEDPKEQSKEQNAVTSSAKSGDWSRLEKLPEGTVAEAYVSFNRFFTTDELLKQFENRNMEAVWFAVDTGPDERFGGGDDVISNPVGFPSYPVWHHDDLTITSYKEEKRGWFGKIVSSGGHYPSIETYGDGELRNEHFIKSLRLLQEYDLIADRVAPFVDVDASLAYVEQNGVRLYGAVITGPVKELLTLREVSWVRDLRVGEVRLWNWTE